MVGVLYTDSEMIVVEADDILTVFHVAMQEGFDVEKALSIMNVDKDKLEELSLTRKPVVIRRSNLMPWDGDPGFMPDKLYDYAERSLNESVEKP